MRQPMRWTGLLVGITVVAAHPRADAGACGTVQRLTPHVLNRRAILPTDGGAVVASLPGDEGPTTPAVGADVTVIAPGLEVHRTVAATPAEPVAKSPPKLPPPVVRSVQYAAARNRRGGASIDAKLARKAPEGALVLVVFEAGKAHKPRSWGLVTHGDELGADPADALTVSLYSEGGRCLETIPDLIPSSVGERIVLAWLDGFGRLSRYSSPITVTRAR